MTLPFWCVAIAFVLIYLPRPLVMHAMSKMPEGFDNNNPRAQHGRLTGFGARALAAHNNAFEAFAPFAAGVVIAHLAHANATALGGVAVAFVVLRTVYLVAYLADWASFRSLVFIGSFLSTVAVYGLAAFA